MTSTKKDYIIHCFISFKLCDDRCHLKMFSEQKFASECFGTIILLFFFRSHL
uniref:ZP domain-containing protein n=1 Tax=Brugia timori TaxID=42155 RepID=A0A0R3R4M1_9BILA